MWWPTVFGEIPSVAATCLLADPRAIRRNTSTSRSVRPAGFDAFTARTVVAGGVEHGVDLDAPEATGVDVVEQLRRGVGAAECRAVGPVLGHRVIGVGGGEQSGADVELVTRQAAVVAGAVGAFVVACGEVGERGEQGAAVQHPLAEVWVQPDSLPLLGAESAPVIPDPAWDADLPDVVHQRRSTQPGGLVDGQPGGSSAATARSATPVE